MALSDAAVTQTETRAESIVEDLSEPIEMDTIVHVMSTERRRWATEYAATHDGRINLRELVDDRTEIEYETAGTDESWGTIRNRVHSSFYQNDMDTLVAAGVLREIADGEHDDREGYVFARGPNAGAIAGFIRVLRWMSPVEEQGVPA